LIGRNWFPPKLVVLLRLSRTRHVFPASWDIRNPTPSKLYWSEPGESYVSWFRASDPVPTRMVVLSGSPFTSG
jgi:hypothetical protein